ncbi:MAG: PrgI family protein [Lachnospiraceae bacterium]|nr:PrgI family protein [Lachnospiraceae bacterium]
MINVPSDLRKNKETIIGNMDLRESICLFLGLMLAIGILYYIRVILGYKRIVIAAFIGGIFIIPFLFIGFKKINGMKVDDYFKIFVNNKIIANEKRLPICSSKEEVVKKKKFELIRYYKLYLRKELINLRGYLKGKGLILTEYIDYNNEMYAIFRLNGKDLILEQIKKNKEEIESKKKEIKAFINDVIKKVKSEKITLTKKNKVARKKQYKEIKEHKKEKVKNLYKKVNLLKLELKTLKNKTFEELKNEVDIFENASNRYAKRIVVKSVNKKEKIILDNSIVNLRKSINEDERNLYQLNLFSKGNFRDFIESIDNKIVFINSDDKVNVYVNKNVENESILVDLTEVDKESGLYTGSIISLEARNFYNHYRSINNLEEIL